MPTPTGERPAQRMEKGAGIVDLAKLLKVYGRAHSLAALGPEGSRVLEERVLVSSWYPLQAVWDMLEFTYTHMLGRDPDKAIALGRVGGEGQWTTTHRALLRENPVDGLLGMSASWAAYFNFGKLKVEPARDERSALLTVTGYEDAPEVHSLTIAGWHLAAARMSGAPGAEVEVLHQPHRGDRDIAHRVYW